MKLNKKQKSFVRCCVSLIIVLALSSFFSFSANAAGMSSKGFDVVLIIDDSGSMGIKLDTRERSDIGERRYEAINMLKKIFYMSSEFAFKNQEQVDFRFSIIQFGDSANLLREWEEIYYKEGSYPPKKNEYPAKNLGWTNFERAFALAVKQYNKNNYSVNRNGSKRAPVILLLTDGEPSLRNDPKLGEDPKFWERLENNYIKKIRNKNDKLRLFVVAFHNPDVDEGRFWQKNKIRWENLGAEFIVITKDESNTKLYDKLEGEFGSKLYKLPIMGANEKGEFNVPCFQDKVYYQVYFYGKALKVVLESPSGVIHTFKHQLKSDTTYAQNSISNPEAGQWRIKNFRGEKYAFRYLSMPYNINYIYPDKNKVFLLIPRKIKAVINRETGEFQDYELKSCNLNGKLEIDEDEDGNADKTIKLTIEKSKTKITLEADREYAPPSNKKSVSTSFILYSNGIEMLRTPWVKCRVSNDKYIMMNLDSNEAVFNGGHCVINARLGFRDYLDAKKRYKLSEVFKNHHDSIQVSISCEGSQCFLVQKGGGLVKPATVLLKQIDNNTMGADVRIKKENSWFSGYLMRLAGKSEKIRISFENTKNMKLQDKIYLMRP